MASEVDRADRAMEVNGPEQLGANRNELHQRRQPALVNRQPAIGEHAVVQQSRDVERPRAVARHVGVAEHEIHVVDRGMPLNRRAAAAGRGGRISRQGGQSGSRFDGIELVASSSQLLGCGTRRSKSPSFRE
jgi:hypothetical protein